MVLVPLALLWYVLPILLGVGGILALGYYFGEGGVRHHQRTIRAFKQSDHLALLRLHPTARRNVTEGLSHVLSSATAANNAVLAQCKPERFPLARTLINEIKRLQETLPAGMISTRMNLSDLAMAAQASTQSCTPVRGRNARTVPQAFSWEIKTLQWQVQLAQAVSPAETKQ